MSPSSTYQRSPVTKFLTEIFSPQRRAQSGGLESSIQRLRSQFERCCSSKVSISPPHSGHASSARNLWPGANTILLDDRAINFATYGNGKRIIANNFNDGQESSWVHLCAAALAGLVTGTATNPIWLVKTRLQLDKENSGIGGRTRQYKNSLDCVRQVVRQEGIKGLYRGLSASYLGVTESTLQWVLYEKMKLYLTKRKAEVVSSGREETSWDNFVDWGGKLGAAGSAKLLAAVLTYPHEVVRTRLRQKPMANGQLKYTGLMQAFKLIWKEEGFVAMYGGLSPHLVAPPPQGEAAFIDFVCSSELYLRLPSCLGSTRLFSGYLVNLLDLGPDLNTDRFFFPLHLQISPS